LAKKLLNIPLVGVLAEVVFTLPSPALAGEGRGEGGPWELPPHLDPLPKGRGRFFFPLFVLTHMSILDNREVEGEA